jgi:hypothetical protein
MAEVLAAVGDELVLFREFSATICRSNQPVKYPEIWATRELVIDASLSDLGMP